MKNQTHSKPRAPAAAALAALLCVAGVASAAPISILTTLTGDTRSEAPDNLKVIVSITGDTTLSYVDLLVKLDMAATHPDAKLDAFYFNVIGNFADFHFSHWSPSSWTIGAGTNAAGSGGTDFLFEADCSPGRCTSVTDTQDLSFRMSKVDGALFMASDFLDADIMTGAAGVGQLGAHVQSLSVGGANGGTQTSGFALGNYAPFSSPRPTLTSSPRTADTVTGSAVPEPGTLALAGVAGLVLLGTAAARWRRAG